jgi:hypothetical protein
VRTSVAEIAGKSLEVIRELLPSARRVAVLANAPDPFTKRFLEQIQIAARALGIEIQIIMVSAADQLDAAFLQIDRKRIDAVIVQPSLPRKRAAELALTHHLARAADEVRVGHQPQDGEGPWLHHPAVAAAARRRGDSVGSANDRFYGWGGVTGFLLQQ